MTTTTTTPDVPMPPGAVRVYEWDRPEVTGFPHQSRYFVGTTRPVHVQQRNEPVAVTIDGHQFADGRIKREITVDELHPDWSITPGGGTRSGSGADGGGRGSPQAHSHHRRRR